VEDAAHQRESHDPGRAPLMRRGIASRKRGAAPRGGDAIRDEAAAKRRGFGRRGPAVESPRSGRQRARRAPGVQLVVSVEGRPSVCAGSIRRIFCKSARRVLHTRWLQACAGTCCRRRSTRRWCKTRMRRRCRPSSAPIRRSKSPRTTGAVQVESPLVSLRASQGAVLAMGAC